MRTQDVPKNLQIPLFLHTTLGPDYYAYTPAEAHSDEPYMQYGKFVEARFHELEHESKIRLLKTHSYTSERRDCEADKERQKNGEKRRPIRKEQEKRERKPPPYHLKGGAGLEHFDGKAENRSSATTLSRATKRNYTTEKRNKKSHSPVPQSEQPKYLDRSRPCGGARSAGRKRKGNEKPTVLCHS